MCSASYGTRSPSVSAMRSRSASGSCSESTSWNTSARRRYDSTSASGRPPAFTPGTSAGRRRRAIALLHTIRRPIGAPSGRLEGRSGRVVPSSDEAAGAGGVRPGVEAAAGAVRARRRLDLRPGGPTVGRAPAGEEVGAVGAHEGPVHLEAPVEAVPRVGVPRALVAVDAHEGGGQAVAGDPSLGRVLRDGERCRRRPLLPEMERPAAVVGAARGAERVRRRRLPAGVDGLEPPRYGL